MNKRKKIKHMSCQRNRHNLLLLILRGEVLMLTFVERYIIDETMNA